MSEEPEKTITVIGSQAPDLKKTAISQADKLKHIAKVAADELKQTAATEAESLLETAASLAKKQLKLLLDNAMFHAIFNSIHDGVVVTDVNGKVLFYNESAMIITGLDSISDNSPVSFTMYYHLYKPDQVTPWPAGEDPLSRAIRGKTTIGELAYVKKEKGLGAFISCMAVPLNYGVGKDNNVIGGVVIFRKIQELSDYI